MCDDQKYLCLEKWVSLNCSVPSDNVNYVYIIRFKGKFSGIVTFVNQVNKQGLSLFTLSFCKD